MKHSKMYWLTLLTVIVTHVDVRTVSSDSNSAFNSSYARYEYTDAGAEKLTELMLGLFCVIVPPKYYQTGGLMPVHSRLPSGDCSERPRRDGFINVEAMHYRCFL